LLVAEKYTSHELIAIEGRSAGGLLIGAVVNKRPDIAHVAIAGVPFVDVINTMMDPSIPLTINEYEEWGNPNEYDYFQYMLSYSPYENVPKGVKMPQMLIKAGLNDPRVQYWEPAKYIAKLRDYQLQLKESDKSLIVFDCKMGSGHFGSSGRYAYYHEISADYAFAIDLLLKAQSNYMQSKMQSLKI
jgi:oligopeptidase B